MPHVACCLPRVACDMLHTVCASSSSERLHAHTSPSASASCSPAGLVQESMKSADSSPVVRPASATCAVRRGDAWQGAETQGKPRAAAWRHRRALGWAWMYRMKFERVSLDERARLGHDRRRQPLRVFDCSAVRSVSAAQRCKRQLRQTSTQHSRCAQRAAQHACASSNTARPPAASALVRAGTRRASHLCARHRPAPSGCTPQYGHCMLSAYAVHSNEPRGGTTVVRRPQQMRSTPKPLAATHCECEQRPRARAHMAGCTHSLQVARVRQHEARGSEGPCKEMAPGPRPL